MPEAPQLAAIRQEIDYNLAEWQQMVSNKAFSKMFSAGVTGSSSLVRPPKGYDEDNAAIYYLKMKGFIVSRPIPDELLMSKTLLKEVAKTFETMKPLIDFLNRAIA